MIRHSNNINTNAIRLDKNECICPTFIKELLSVADVKAKDYFLYSSVYEVGDKLSNILGITDLFLNFDNGSEQVLRALVETLDCDRWVIPYPTFEMFPLYCFTLNKQVNYIPYNYIDNKFTIELVDSNSRDSGLYVVSPHNPTGYILADEDIVALCSQYKFVIVDQAYLSPLDNLKIEKFPKNLIIVRTFSKMGGLTGMRFGFSITSDSSLNDRLNAIRPMYLNSVTIKLVNTILNYPYLLNKIFRDFNLIKRLLDVKIISEAGNFILVDNIKEYKNYKLKKYTFNDKDFYRMTLFDMETYNSL